MDKKEKLLIDQMRHSVHMQGPLQCIRDILDRGVAVYQDRICIVEKQRDTVLQHSFREFYEDAFALGTSLIDMGLQGKHIAICSENSYYWLVSFFAISCGTGVSVPIDRELSDEDICKLVEKGDCDALIFSKTYWKTAQLYIQEHPDFTACISMNRPCEQEKFYTIQALIEKGKALIKQGDTRFMDSRPDAEDLAAIIFTSGTTGANKGVMLTHHNFSTNVDGIIDTIPTEYTSFSVLPMNHVFELSGNDLTSLYMNAIIYINDSLKNILANIQLFKPDAISTVPLILEGIYNGIWAAAEKKGKAEALKKLVGISNDLRKKGIDMRHVLFASVRKSFGDKFPTLVCGGAPTRAEYVSGLGDFGFRIYNGYGLTESSPTVTLNMQADKDPTSAGFAFPKSKFAIHEPDADGIGEIWIRGENVTKGYYKDEAATAASFEDGWFKTGDYGRVTPKGELFVSGRKKTLIILDNGKNIFPEDLEFHFMNKLPYIREGCAFETLKTILNKKEKIIAFAVYVDVTDFDGATEEEIIKKVTKDISECNKLLPSYKKIQDTAVFFSEFEKTSTRKIIRQKVIERYEAQKK